MFLQLNHTIPWRSERKLSVAAVVTKARTFEEDTQTYGVPRTIILQDTRSQLSKLFGIERITAGNQQLKCPRKMAKQISRCKADSTFFNEVLHEAFTAFVNGPKCKQTLISSFAKTNIRPMGAVDINIESISSDSEVCDEECNTVIGSIRKHSRVAATISDRGDTISTLKPEKSRAVL